jgi:outer membrane biosynthesis protein TonB
VELRVIIGEDGRVHALHIIKGHPMLVPASYNAVRKWEFKPYVENGKTLPVDTNVTIHVHHAMTGDNRRLHPRSGKIF